MYLSLFSSSEFYLLNSYQLLNNYSHENEHVQYGEHVYIATLINKEIFIVGFDQTSGEFIVTKLEETINLLENQGGPNRDSLLWKYEWRLENIPISNELLGGLDYSSIPNTQSVKYNDLFTIKFKNEQVICVNNSKAESRYLCSQLSIGNVTLAGRNSFWTIFPLKSEGTVYPDWFLMKKILRSKNNNSLKFLDNKLIEKSTKIEFSALENKMGMVQMNTLNLVSEPPIGWNIANIYLSEDGSVSNAPNTFLDKELSQLPSLTGYVFDHAKNGIDSVIKQNIIPCKLSTFSIKIQEHLMLEDILNCLLCNDGNYIKVVEKTIEIFNEDENLNNISENLYIIKFGSTLNHYDNLSFNSLVSGREGISLFFHQIVDDPGSLQNIGNYPINIIEELNLKNNLNESFELDSILSTNNLEKNPSLYPLTYKTLELSSLNRRIKQFLKVHESGNSQFGVISESLCDTFRELLKHFATKVSKFESQLRKGQLTIQSIWSHSQQALVTLKVLDLISTRVLYKKGCEIIDQVYYIANNDFKGEEPSQKIAVFVFNQLFLTWYKRFLVPWLKFGLVSDHFSEFNGQNLSDLIKKPARNMYSQIFNKQKNNQSLMLPSFLQESFEHVNYIGLVSYFIRRANHLYARDLLSNKGNEGQLCCKVLETTLEQILSSLNNNSDLIRQEGIKEYINNLFIESQRLLFKVCGSITNIKSQIISFYEIFLCANDSLYQEFIEHICKLGFGGNKSGYHTSNDITRKWSELMAKYYGKSHDLDGSIRFSCKIVDNLTSEYPEEELFRPVRWEISSYVLNEEELKSTRKENDNFSSFEAYKYLTIESHGIKAFSSIWPRELLKKYEAIFRLIFNLKYMNHLLNNIWVIHQTSNIWSNQLSKTKYLSVSRMLCKSYFLRQKMLLLTTGILEYIYNDVINPLWDSMIQDLKNISTLEELNSRQDELLNEVLTQCFHSESEQLYTLYTIFSLCHLFSRHSNLLNIYWFSSLTGTNTCHYSQAEKENKLHEKTRMRNSCNKNNSSGRTKGRMSTNKEHTENLLLDSTYNDIVNKFSSKFEQLLHSFFNKISNSKCQNINLLNKLMLKLNYNGYYLGAPESTIDWGELTFDKDTSCHDFVI